MARRPFKRAPKYKKGLGHECRFECGRESVYVDSDTCCACYQWFWKWLKSTPNAFFKRKKEIDVLVARAEELATPKLVRKTGTG